MVDSLKLPTLALSFLMGVLCFRSSVTPQLTHDVFHRAGITESLTVYHPLRTDSSSELRYRCVSAGMGLTYISAPDIVAYINSLATAQQTNELAAAGEFLIAPEIQISDLLALKLEYSYLTKPYNVDVSNVGTYHFSYYLHMPSLVLSYLIVGNGYYFKFGGGMGYHYGVFTQRFPNSTADASYSASGVGFKLEAVGNTTLGGRLCALVAAALRGDFIGQLEDKDSKPVIIRRPYSGDTNARLGFLSFGIMFGLAYYF